MGTWYVLASLLQGAFSLFSWKRLSGPRSTFQPDQESTGTAVCQQVVRALGGQLPVSPGSEYHPPSNGPATSCCCSPFIWSSWSAQGSACPSSHDGYPGSEDRGLPLICSSLLWRPGSCSQPSDSGQTLLTFSLLATLRWARQDTKVYLCCSSHPRALPPPGRRWVLSPFTDEKTEA